MSAPRLFRRIRSVLSIEGVVFTIILGFVAVCSVLRSVNMLVVVSGMMLAAIIMSWRVCRHIVRHITASREIPVRLHVGQPVNIQWKVANYSGHSIFQVRVVDTIQQLTSRLGDVVSRRRVRSSANRGSILFKKIENGSVDYSSFRILFSERGVYQLGPATIESRFPLSLVVSWFRIDEEVNVHVAPQLGVLAQNWDRIILSLNRGSTSRSNFEGTQEDEFFAIREWRSGDNKRRIHWRSSAKKRQPMVKQFERITEQHRAIVVDLFASPRHAQEFLQKTADCERALSFTATVLSTWSQQPVGNLFISICGQQPCSFSSTQHVEFARQCMQSLAVARHSDSVNLNQAIQELMDGLPMGTPVFVVSSRDKNEVLDQMDSSVLQRVHWLSVGNTDFDQLFSVEDKSRVFVAELKVGAEA